MYKTLYGKCILWLKVCHTSTTAPQNGNPGEVRDRGERCHGLGLGLLLLPALGRQLLKAVDMANFHFLLVSVCPHCPHVYRSPVRLLQNTRRGGLGWPHCLRTTRTNVVLSV